MPKEVRRLPGRGKLLAWGAIVMVPFLLANTCFKTTTAPDYVPPGDDSTGSDTTSSMQVAFSVLSGSDGPGWN